MKTLTVFIFVLGTLAFGGMANAQRYLTKCDVVRSLRSYNVPESEIRDCKSITRNMCFAEPRKASGKKARKMPWVAGRERNREYIECVTLGRAGFNTGSYKYWELRYIQSP